MLEEDREGDPGTGRGGSVNASLSAEHAETMDPQVGPRRESIFGCTEIDAIARDLSFVDYQQFHSMCREQGAEVDEQFYADLRKAFNDFMDREWDDK